MEAQRPRSSCQHGWVLVTARLLNGQLVPVPSHGCPSVSVSSPSYKETSHIELGFTLMTSFQSNDPFKGPVSRYSPILRNWGLGPQHMNLKSGGHRSAHNRPVRCFSQYGFLLLVELTLHQMQKEALKNHQSFWSLEEQKVCFSTNVTLIPFWHLPSKWRVDLRHRALRRQVNCISYLLLHDKLPSNLVA